MVPTYILPTWDELNKLTKIFAFRHATLGCKYRGLLIEDSSREDGLCFQIYDYDDGHIIANYPTQDVFAMLLSGSWELLRDE